MAVQQVDIGKRNFAARRVQAASAAGKFGNAGFGAVDIQAETVDRQSARHVDNGEPAIAVTADCTRDRVARIGPRFGPKHRPVAVHQVEINLEHAAIFIEAVLQRVPATRGDLVMVDRVQVFARSKIGVVGASNQQFARGAVLGHMEDEVAQMPPARIAGCDRVVEPCAIGPAGIEIHLDFRRPVAGPVRPVTVKPGERSVARRFADKRVAGAIFRSDAVGTRGNQRHHAPPAPGRIIDRVGGIVETADELTGRIGRDHRRVVGAGNGDGHVDRVGRALRICHDSRKRFRLGLSCRQCLRCRSTIVDEIGPHTGIGVDGEVAVGSGRITGPLQLRGLAAVDITGHQLARSRRQKAVGLVEGQRVVGLAFVPAIDRPAGQAQVVDRLGQFGVQRRLRIRGVGTERRVKELVGQRRAVEVAEQVVMQALQALRNAVAIVVGLELGDHVIERRTAALDVLGIFQSKPDKGLVDGIAVIRAVVGVEMLPDSRDCVRHRCHAGHRQHRLQHRGHIVIVARSGQQSRNITADGGEIGNGCRRRGRIRVFRRSTGHNRVCLDHRCVVGAGNGDGHGDRVGRRMRIGHSRHEAVGDALALGQRLRRGKAVVELVDPLAGVGIDRERAVDAGRIARPQQLSSLAIVHIRGRQLARGRLDIAVGDVEVPHIRIRGALVARVVGTGQKVGVNAADQVGQRGFKRIAAEALRDRGTADIAQKVVMKALHPLRNAVAVVVRCVFRRHVDERADRAGLEQTGIGRAKTDEGLVDRILSRTAIDIIVVEIIPDHRNRLARITAKLGGDRGQGSLEPGPVGLQPVQHPLRTSRQSHIRTQRTAKARLIDIGNVAALGH